MYTYYINKDGFIVRQDKDRNFCILSWKDMEFWDYREAFFEDSDPDLKQYTKVTSEEVKALVQDYLDEISEKGKQLIMSL